MMTLPPASRRIVSRELITRSIAALTLAPVVLLSIWAGGVWFALLVVVTVGVGAFEWARLCGGNVALLIVVLVPLGPIVAAALLTMGLGVAVLTIVFASAFVLFVSLASQTEWPKQVWPSIGTLYLGVPAAAILVLRVDSEHGLVNLLFLVGTVWLTDIGAYFFGRLVGGARLAPRISPSKTWAGAIGGLLLAVTGAYFAAEFLAPQTAFGAIPLAIILSLATQCGDLFESWAKRRFGKKDSGAIIPGHGGILDRIDGLLFAAPVMAALTIAQRGTVPLWP